jgi:hypothetical protein
VDDNTSRSKTPATGMEWTNTGFQEDELSFNFNDYPNNLPLLPGDSTVGRDNSLSANRFPTLSMASIHGLVASNTIPRLYDLNHPQTISNQSFLDPTVDRYELPPTTHVPFQPTPEHPESATWGSIPFAAEDDSFNENFRNIATEQPHSREQPNLSYDHFDSEVSVRIPNPGSVNAVLSSLTSVSEYLREYVEQSSSTTSQCTGGQMAQAPSMSQEELDAFCDSLKARLEGAVQIMRTQPDQSGIHPANPGHTPNIPSHTIWQARPLPSEPLRLPLSDLFDYPRALGTGEDPELLDLNTLSPDLTAHTFFPDIDHAAIPHGDHLAPALWVPYVYNGV